MAKAAAVWYSLLSKGYMRVSIKNTECYRLCYPGIFPKLYRSLPMSKHCILSTSLRFSTVPKSNPPNEASAKATVKKKGKIDAGPMITLMGIDGNISVVSLLEAQKMSTRRNLKLVLVKEIDTKTIRPEYKLMTTTQYLQEEKDSKDTTKKKTTTIKGEKIVNINHNITEHDLNTRIKNIIKWISKSYEVRIVINGDSENMSNAEHVYEAIAKVTVKEGGRLAQKRQKGRDLRFQILPPKKEKNAEGG